MIGMNELAKLRVKTFDAWYSNSDFQKCPNSLFWPFQDWKYLAIFMNMWSSRFFSFWPFWIGHFTCGTLYPHPLFVIKRKESIQEISKVFPFDVRKHLDRICIKVLPIFQKVQKDPQKRLQGHFMKEEYGSPQPWGSKSPIGEQSVLMAGVARLYLQCKNLGHPNVRMN